MPRPKGYTRLSSTSVPASRQKGYGTAPPTSTNSSRSNPRELTTKSRQTTKTGRVLPYAYADQGFYLRMVLKCRRTCRVPNETESQKPRLPFRVNYSLRQPKKLFQYPEFGSQRKGRTMSSQYSHTRRLAFGLSRHGGTTTMRLIPPWAWKSRNSLVPRRPLVIDVTRQRLLLLNHRPGPISTAGQVPG